VIQYSLQEIDRAYWRTALSARHLLRDKYVDVWK